VEAQSRLAEEAQRVQNEAAQLNTQISNFATMQQGRNASRIPPGMVGQALFHSPQQWTPPRAGAGGAIAPEVTP